MQTTSLKPQEVNNLINTVDSKDLYDAVISFVDSIKEVGRFPCPIEEFQKIADEAVLEARQGGGKTSSELRK